MSGNWAEADRPFDHPLWVRTADGTVHKVIGSSEGFYCLVCGDNEPEEREAILVTPLEERIVDGHRRPAMNITEDEKCAPGGCWG